MKPTDNTMTTLNTIIEEEKKEFDNFMLEEYGKWKIGRTEAKAFLTTAMQRAYEAGREERDTYWKERVRNAIDICEDVVKGSAGSKSEIEGAFWHLREAITNEDNLK